MIFHLFVANARHHVPEMARNILKYSELTNNGGKDEHFFWLRSSKRDKKDLPSLYKELFKDELNHEGFCFIKSNLRLMFLIRRYSAKNIIVIHSNQSLYRRPLLFWFFIHFFLNRIQKKNIVQVLWGLPMSIEEKNSGIVRKAMFKMQCKAMSSLSYVVVLSEEDFRKAKQFYNLKGNLIQASYILNDSNKYLEKSVRIDSRDNCRIMVAHSAFSHNNHFSTFKYLEKFKDKNIEIICPLSYGDESYKKDVVKKGNEIFDVRFIPHLVLLPIDEYNKLLASIDIYISHAEMQTSLYVVYSCISAGTKMYLNQNNYNWMVHQGFKVNHVNELEGLTYEEFVNPLPQDWVEHNIDLAKRILTVEERAKNWKLIYSYKND